MIKNKSKKFYGLLDEEWIELQESFESKDIKVFEKAKLIQEKLRRYVSFYNFRLYKVSKKRFKSRTITELENIFKTLLENLIKDDFIKNEQNFNTPNSSNLNAALYTFEALKKVRSKNILLYSKKLKILKKELKDFLEKKFNKGTRSKINNNKFFNSLEIKKLKKTTYEFSEPILIISPSKYSLYTLSFLGICFKYNIPVKSIIIRKYSVKRFKNELQRDGLRLIKKIYRKLILKTDENPNKTFMSFKVLTRFLAPQFNDVSKIALKKNIPTIFVNEFDDAIDFIKKNKAKIGLFTGGGLISKEFLAQFEIGIINLHMGILPFYKGIDVVESPLIQGEIDKVGFTSHLMESKLDAGPIIEIYKISPLEYNSIGKLRNEMALIMPFLLLDSYLKLIKSNLKVSNQENIGKQYYFLHKDLRKIVNETLAKYYSKNTKTEIQIFIESIIKSLKSN